MPPRPEPYVIVPASARYPRNDEASVVQLHSGDLFLVWSRFESLNRDEQLDHAQHDPATGLPGHDLNSDNAPAVIAGLTSSDGGLTWHGERTVIENEAGLNVMNPSLARLADGRLGMVYNHRDSTTEAHRPFRVSADEGATWSTPVRFTPPGYFTGCNDRLVVLKSGRIIAPLHTTTDWHAHYLQTHIAWSDNGGTSWTVGPPIQLPQVAASGESGAWEPDVVQRHDGSLLLILRTAMGTIFRAESADEGETWHDLRSMEVVAPVAPAIIRRLLGSEILLLIWNWHYDWREPLGGRRCPLACAVSYDGGSTWVKRRTLADDLRYTYAYPSALVMEDIVFVTYYQSAADDPFGPRSLMGMRMPVAWLTA